MLLNENLGHHTHPTERSSFEEYLPLQGSTKADDPSNGEFSTERFLGDDATEFDRLPEIEQPEDNSR